MRYTQTTHIIRTILGLSGINYRLRKLRSRRARGFNFLDKILPAAILILGGGIGYVFLLQPGYSAEATQQKLRALPKTLVEWLKSSGPGVWRTPKLASVVTPGPANEMAAACTLAQSVQVSGCYYSNSASRAMVSVEVGWTGAMSGDVITVTLDGGAQTRTINPEALYSSDGGTPLAGPLVSPQIVSFEITADAGSHTVISSLAGASSCATSLQNFSAPGACAPNLCTSGELGGTVYIDFNGDGQRQTGELIGAVGAIVRAFNSTNQLAGTAVSDSSGRYEFSAANNNAIVNSNYPLRLEFSNLPLTGLQTTTRMGDNNGSSVQFVSAAQCNVDIGVLDMGNYCRNNPLVALPCYVNGDPLPTGTSGDGDALVAFPYNSAGGPGPAIHLATARQTGALWGVAYNKQTNRLFSAAFLKRHAGLGPLGPGGIYVSDPTAITTSSFIDIASLGINVGQASIPSNVARGLDPNKVFPNNDTAAFPLVGKVGIGGIDLSADGNTLWLVNLNDQKIYSIDITTYNSNGALPTAAGVGSATIPSPGCTGGNSRPFGIEFYNGRVYVGTVCDGSSGTRSDLKAAIFAYNPQDQTWSTQLSFPLTYHRGPASFPQYTGWYTWTDDFADMLSTAIGGRITHPTPILLDLEFDVDGSMLIGFGDRSSLQLGYDNYGPLAGDTTFYSSIIAGDALRAYYSNNSYHLENNAKAGPNTGAWVGNNQGPGTGEFYDDNFVCCHDENFQGGLALRPGSSQLMVVCMDPVKDLAIVNAAGVRTLNNLTGAAVNNFYLFSNSINSTNGLFGKGASLGDAELVCTQPDFLEIGNRVWMDAIFDGIQGAGEMPIAGLGIRLYRQGGADGIVGNGDDNTPVATAITASDGAYRFTSQDANEDGVLDSDADANDNIGLVNGVGLLPNTRYVIRADRAQDYASGGALFGKLPTLSDADNGGYGSAGDLRDSDATTGNLFGLSSGNFPEIEVKHLVGAAVTNGTGQYGQVDHTFDFGFVINTMSLGNLVWKDANGNGIRESNEPGLANVKLNLYRDNGDSTFNATTDQLAGMTTTDTNGLYLFQSLIPGTYFVQVDTSNFVASGPLFGCLSTIPSTQANNDQDNDNNGANNANPVVAPPTSSAIILLQETEPTTDGDGNNGNNTVDFGFLSPLMNIVESAGDCAGSGTSIEVQSRIINAGAGTQNDNPGPEIIINLPSTLAAVAGSCQSQGGNGACVVNSASQVIWNGSLAQGATLTLSYLVQGTNLAASGANLCIPLTANFDADLNGSNETAMTSETCIRADCTPVGPGSQSDPGCSVLIYPIYTSNPANPGAQNTRINITNINPTNPQAAHMFFVDGATCSIADSYICLTANQTTSFVLSDLDPGTTGYLIVVAVDPTTGCPANSNYLLGDEYVKFESGHAANLKAECIIALPGGLPACNSDTFTTQLRFDGISYSMLPRVVAFSSLADRAGGNDTMLILDSINGNLWTGLDRLGAIFGLAYDDAETPASFSFNPGTCQFRNSISNSFPRTTPRIDTLIPAGRSGWMKLWTQSDAALVGAAITHNPALSTLSSAFAQGHTLHKLRFTATASLTIPVFPPSC